MKKTWTWLNPFLSHRKLALAEHWAKNFPPNSAPAISFQTNRPTVTHFDFKPRQEATLAPVMSDSADPSKGRNVFPAVKQQLILRLMVRPHHSPTHFFCLTVHLGGSVMKGRLTRRTHSQVWTLWGAAMAHKAHYEKWTSTSLHAKLLSDTVFDLFDDRFRRSRYSAFFFLHVIKIPFCFVFCFCFL